MTDLSTQFRPFNWMTGNSSSLRFSSQFRDEGGGNNPLEPKPGEIYSESEKTNNSWFLGSNSVGAIVFTGVVKFFNAAGKVVRVVTRPVDKNGNPVEEPKANSQNN